jgi:hypothetical protein
MTDGLRPWSNAEMDMGVFPILPRESCGSRDASTRDVTLMMRARVMDSDRDSDRDSGRSDYS